MGKYQRDKGAGYEREIVHALKAIYPHAERGLGQARSGGDIPDVDGTPFWIECKRGKSCSAHAAIKQARDNSKIACEKHRKPKRIPIAILRRDTETSIAVMDLATFAALAACAGWPWPPESR